MEKLIIKNGIVFDPINKIEGEVKDILIENSKIVEKFSSKNNIKEIDASEKTVIPAAIDTHTHVASQQVNWARLLGTKNSKFKEIWKGLTLEKIARDYISNGYTFILEANVFPSLAKQTIFNFKHLPVVDKAMLLNVSNLWPLELEFQKGKIDDMAIFLSDLLSKTKGFGFKAYNPFESENWSFNSLRDDIAAKGRLYNFSALEVYKNLAKVNETLGLPHSLHAHIEGYEHLKAKSNLSTILNVIISLDLEPNPQNDLQIKRSQILHLAHASAYNIDGDNSELIKCLETNNNIDLDLGFIGFNQINPLITSDRRLINSMLNKNNNEKIISSAMEFEGDSFATFRIFEKSNKSDCYLWANAIDLALNVKNKWQLQMSTNYPNYADINDIPDIAAWLMCYEERNEFMKGMNSDFLNNTYLKGNTDFLAFNDFIIITRASPAKSLGIGSIKGNLGSKADADINILDININEINISKDIKELKNSFSNIEYVIKAGNIVKKGDKIDLSPEGNIFWSERKIEKAEKKLVMSKKEEFYIKYYSTFYKTLETNIEPIYLRQI